MFLLNDKIKDVKPYDPEMGDTPIHLDANESFLPLPVPILEELAAALPQVAFNRYPDPAARKLCQPLPPITASRRRTWPRVTALTS